MGDLLNLSWACQPLTPEVKTGYYPRTTDVFIDETI